MVLKWNQSIWIILYQVYYKLLFYVAQNTVITEKEKRMYIFGVLTIFGEKVHFIIVQMNWIYCSCFEFKKLEVMEDKKDYRGQL